MHAPHGPALPGENSVRLARWRDCTNAAARKARAVRRSEEQRARQFSALRMVMRVLVRVLKGRCAVLLVEWRLGWQEDKATRHREGLRRLGAVLLGQARGATRLLVQAWRTECDHTRQEELKASKPLCLPRTRSWTRSWSLWWLVG